MSCKFSILALVTFFILPAEAQFQQRKSYSFAQGLSTYNIKKTIQDKYGFIWIATQDGVYRFDGTEFDPIKKNSTKNGSIRENFILDIAFGKNEDLFVSSFNGGIDRINIRTLVITPFLSLSDGQHPGLPNLAVTRMFCDKRGNLWIGGEDFIGIVRANELIYRPLEWPSGYRPKGKYVTFVQELNDSSVVIGLNEAGILFYDNRSLHPTGIMDISLQPGLGHLPLNGAVYINEVLYIGAGPHLVSSSLQNGKWQINKRMETSTPGHQTINCLAHGPENSIWLGTVSGIYVFNTLTSLIKSADKPDAEAEKQYINDLYFDNQEGLWICTSRELQRLSLRPSPFRPYSENQDKSIRMNHIYSLVNKSKEEIYACGIDGLYECRLSDGFISKINESGTIGIIHFILKLNEERWLISSDYGMHLYLPEKGTISKYLLEQFYPEWKPYSGHFFNNAVESKGKIYWASEEQEGLLIWEPATKRMKQFKAGTANSGGIPENHMHNIKTDRKGNIWLLFDNAVARFDPQIDSVTKIIWYKQGGAGFNAGIFFDMYDDGKNLWFGTYGGGLNRFNPDNEEWGYITEKEGLCNNAVYSILEENDSIFWVSTNNGISRVNHHSVQCRNFYKHDGLQDNSFDEKGSLRMDNRLLFAGVNGFTLIDPSLYTAHSITYPVYIKRVAYYAGNSLTELNNLNWKKLKLPPGTSSVSIWLSALNYAGNSSDFSYKIKGFFEEYVEAGKDNKIQLNALNHGTYEIFIRYRKESGEFVLTDFPIEIEILPYWYQTNGFRFLIAFLVLALTFYMIRRAYRAKLKKERLQLEKQLAVQEERQRIAAEMHDDIGAGLSGIRLMTERAATLTSDQAALTELKKIYRSVGDIASKMKEVIWSLNTAHDKLGSLINFLQRQLQVWLENYPCQLNIQLPESIPDWKLTGEIRRNIYLSVKEAVHNIIKHSRANVVSFVVQLDGPLRITVSDNGKGLTENADNFGNGLKNMRARMEKINGKMSIQHRQGTTLEFEVPINE